MSQSAIAKSQLSSVAVDFTKNQTAEQQTNLLRTSEGISVFRQGDPAFFLSPSQPIPITTPTPFLTVAPSAEIQAYSQEQIQIQVRFSDDGVTWNSWIEIDRFEDGPQISQLFIGNLLYLDSTRKYFQYMVLFSQQLQTLTPSKLKNLTFDFFSPGEVQALMPGMVSKLPNPINEQTSCGCPQPGYATRTDWNCPDGQNPSCVTPEFTTTTHLIVHHSAGSNTSTNWAATVLSIWNFHVNTNGWCDIGYNWVIDPNGVIYEGRGGGNNVKGAHFCAANSGTMGICLLGNYESQPPTPAALESLRKLLTWKSCDASLDPMGSSYHPSTGKNLSVISGHREGCATQCPGDSTVALMSDIRYQVDTALAACSGLSSIGGPLAQTDFRLFPNPATAQVTIAWTQEALDQGSWKLMNPHGQVLRQEEKLFFPGDNRFRVSTGDLPDGMYVVEVRSGESVMRKQLMVRR